MRSTVSVAVAMVCSAGLAYAASPAAKFLARRDYATPVQQQAVADTNADGNPDIIELGGYYASVLLGSGNGTFRTGPSSALGLEVSFGISTDVNKDGRPDLVCSGQISNDTEAVAVAVAFGNGDGTYQTATVYPAGSDVFIGNPVYADFNGDGIPDIAAAAESGIWLFTGRAGGTFNPGVLTPLTGTAFATSAAADFNGDGKLDLAVTTETGFDILFGNGKGGFKVVTSTGSAGGRWLTVGDVNGDGHPDLVVASGSGNYLLVYLGNGKGGFAAPKNANIPSAEQFAMADVNGDGILDLIASLGYVAFGNGDGTFKKATLYPLGVGDGFTETDVVPAVLRKQGLTDLVFGGAARTSVLLNKGKGTFEDGEWTAIASASGCGAPSDFNGDGQPDLAVNTSTGILVLLGTGKESRPFQTGASISLSGAGCPVTGDLNGDGTPDLLVPSNGTVVAYLGNGDGTFTEASTTSTPSGGFVAVGDFNHDGKLDFATSGNLLALGNGDGTFQAPAPIVTGLYDITTNIAAGDINEDGWTDVVLTAANDSYIYVLLNNQHGGFTETQIHVQEGALLHPAQVILADLGNGALDIIAAEEFFGTAVVYLGNGSGSFTYSGLLIVGGVGGESAGTIAVSDVNGDGIPDVVITQGGVGSVGVFLGKGNGTFDAPYYVGVGPNPGDILLQNLHGQPASCGMPDIVAPDATGGVSVLMNLSASTCPGL